MAAERFCPRCRAAARSSSTSSEIDDTEDLDVSQLSSTSNMVITEAGMSLVYVLPGEFIMGSDKHEKNEKPEHNVYLDAYYMGRFPVTNWQYNEFMKETGQPMAPFMQKPGYMEPDQPVVGLGWRDAQEFCEWLSKKTKKHYFLPTEAQWEKAARGTEGNLYPWGNDKPDESKAHYRNQLSAGPPAEVTSHSDGKSTFGCFDMAGNIWEWTSDIYIDNYDDHEYDNPERPSTVAKRALRGGGRAGRGDFLHCSRRLGAEQDATTKQTGFRVARKYYREETLSGGDARRKHEARAIVRQAKNAIAQNRRHHARTLVEKALELNPDNRAAKQVLKSMPSLPDGLEPAKGTEYHAETGLPLEVFCEWTGSTMVLVPAGKFVMGSDKGGQDERPAREVYLDSFYIDKFEVTNEMFTMFLDMKGIEATKEALTLFEPSKHGVVMRGNRWTPAPRLRKHPMVCVTWYGAQMYAEWAGMALPTEAQWEKAARGTDERLYPWGNKFGADRCNCKASGIMHTTPVGKYPNGISPHGCWDMAGNVWEWCYDWYDPDYYAHSESPEPIGPPDGEMKVLRSGGWGADASAMRCSARYFCPPEIHIDTLGGFRCVKLLTPRTIPEEHKSVTVAKKVSELLRKPIIGGQKTTDK